MAFSFNTIAQNLVPNYSFENYTKCVNGYDEFNGYVMGWTGQEGAGALSLCTSQCNDSSNTLTSAGLPYNFIGFQYAHTGKSYTEMMTFGGAIK